VNIAAGLVLGISVWLLISAPAGAAVFAVSLLLIYLRGYLVPGTPSLTERYFPPWLLGWFGKRSADIQPHTSYEGSEADGDWGDSREVEAILREADAIVDVAGDLRLSDAFIEDLFSVVSEIDDTPTPADQPLNRLFGLRTNKFDVDAGAIFLDVENGFRVQWSTVPAFRVDIAAGRLLIDRVSDWTDLPPGNRNEVLEAVRLFLDRCPNCHGEVTITEQSVPSCCTDISVTAVECQECNTRFLELDSAVSANEAPPGAV